MEWQKYTFNPFSDHFKKYILDSRLCVDELKLPSTIFQQQQQKF